VTEEQPERALSTVGSGAQTSGARLRCEVVVREGGPWSGSVLGLLRHFEDVGFDGAPRVVGDGLDAAGRELLTYLPGSSPHPYAWPDPAMPVLGELLRRAHGAGRGFVPAAEGPRRNNVWSLWRVAGEQGVVPVAVEVVPEQG